MNDALKMQISAFVDGELPENEAELLLRRLNQDMEMRQQVARYLAIGRCLRREAALPGMDALRSRIANALGEDAYSAVPSPTPVRERYMKPALGLALAASVAVLAVIGLRQVILPGAEQTMGVTNAGNADALAITQAPADDALSEELRYMYRRHSASSADFGGNGNITRLVTLELQGGELVELDPREGKSGAKARVNAPETAIERLDETGDEPETQAD